MPMKPTPAPWHLFNKNGVLEIQKAGKPIVHWRGFDAAFYSDAKKLANAKVIAAAPEMLMCLESAKNELCLLGDAGGKAERIVAWIDDILTRTNAR